MRQASAFVVVLRVEAGGALGELVGLRLVLRFAARATTWATTQSPMQVAMRLRRSEICFCQRGVDGGQGVRVQGARRLWIRLGSCRSRRLLLGLWGLGRRRRIDHEGGAGEVAIRRCRRQLSHGTFQNFGDFCVEIFERFGGLFDWRGGGFRSGLRRARRIRSWRAFQSGGNFGFGLQNCIEAFFALGHCFAQRGYVLERAVLGRRPLSVFCG